jgi:glycosyltransferase involved in cell wall biosynthesis
MKNQIYKPLDVIIVTKNRPSQLLECVKHILNNTLLPQKIIIIDSSESPNVESELNKLVNKTLRTSKIYFIYKNILDKGLGYSRNQGIQLVTSPFFAFIDDDEYAPRSWIKTIFDLYQKDEDLIVICGTKKAKDLSNYWNRVWETVMAKTFTFEGFPDLIPAGNSCYKTEFIKKYKIQFDPRMKKNGEERTFSDKIYKYTRKVLYSNRLYIIHDFRSNFRSFSKQWFTYGEEAALTFVLKHDENKNSFKQILPELHEYLKPIIYRISSSNISDISLYFGIFIKNFMFWIGFIAQLLNSYIFLNLKPRYLR